MSPSHEEKSRVWRAWIAWPRGVLRWAAIASLILAFLSIFLLYLVDGSQSDDHGKPDDIIVVKDNIFGDSLQYPAVAEVILRFRHGHYIIDTDLMRKPPMTADQLWARAQTIRSLPWPSDLTASGIYELQNSMVRLIYGGNADQAWQLLNMAWPSKADRKEEYIRDFYRCRLRSSKYWLAIAAMNDLPADPSVRDCRK